MKNRIIYALLIFLCLSFFVQAQLNKAKFQNDFFKASARTKVRLIGSIPYSDIKEIYPFIKDTLDAIKKNIYQQPASANKDLKFLFDKIDAEQEIFNQNYGKSIFILEDALRHTASNIDDTLTCLSMLKHVFVKIKNVNRAFEIQHMLENKWSRKSDTVNIDFGLNKSYLYHMLGFKTESLRERRKEYNSIINKHDTIIEVNFCNDMGVFLNRQKAPDSAQVYFLRAKHLLAHKMVEKDREAYYDFYKGLIDGNLGLSYFIAGKLNDAIPLLKRDAYFSVKSGSYESAFNSYIILFGSYVQLKEKNTAAAYLDTVQSIYYSKLHAPANLKLKLLPALAQYYAFVKDYKKSNEIYRDYFRMNDSILLFEKERDVINQGLSFNIQQRELAYSEQENQLKQIQTEEARQKSYRATLIGGVLILLLIIAFLTANNRRFKKRETQLSIKNKQIQVQNTQIEQSLKEKEALIKEIHHRVKNNLQIITSMLNLQIGKIEDEKTENIFFEAKQRINAIALTHQMLYQKTTISNINLVEYIETLVRQIEATMSSTKIEIITNLTPTNERLTIDGAVPLGLIINELLTNSYKHAFPKGKKGIITVSLTENTDSFTIKVSDNGIGLPVDFDQTESKTLGMELVFILVEQLDAKLKIENTDGSAFSFDIKKHP